MIDAVWSAFWQAIETVGWTLGVVLYVMASWVAAVLIRKSAPMTCPKGEEYHACNNEHLFHVDRAGPQAVVYGLAWPIVLGALIGKGFIKSIELTDGLPTPKLLKHPTVVQADRQLEAARKKEDLDPKKIEALEEEAFVKPEPLEGTVWHPPTDDIKRGYH